MRSLNENENKQNNLYDQIISLKEKNQNLQIKLHELMYTSQELEDKTKELQEVENLQNILQEENK